ncbi:MAG: carboxypeptidase-like regulatory domain-containing protein [Xanthomonadales bacterium]|nr:carboxypeptidase-like regulatory domain-containing protein [Xanthomonadales bacterium]
MLSQYIAMLFDTQVYIVGNIISFVLNWALILLATYFILFALARITRWALIPKRKWLWAVLVASIWITYPWFNIVEEISGRVVDETGQPIEGVLVTAIWLAHLRRLKSGFLEGKDLRASKLANAMESVTDTDGRYHFPGFFYVSPLLWRMKKDEPDMGFYKKGLGTDYSLTNFPKDKALFKTDLLRKSKFNNIDVVMVKVDAKTQQTSDENQALEKFVWHTLYDFNCSWTNIPGALVYYYQFAVQDIYEVANIPKAKVKIFEDQVSLFGSGSPYSRSMKECGVDIGFFKGLSEWNIKILPEK